MSSIERDLISKILHERDLTVVTDAGITPAFFLRHEHREAFKAILAYQREYSEIPSIDAFHRDYPSYEVTEPQDPLRYFCDELSDNYESYLLEDGLVKATDLFDAGDYDTAKNVIAQTLMQLNREITKVKAVDLTVDPLDRVKKYQEYSKVSDGMRGISTGFDFIDVATGGMQPAQLFVYAGPPKAGKSTMLLLSMMLAHMAFYRPLFIGFEMSNQEQEERHDAIRAGVSHEDLRHGRLGQEGFKKLEKMAKSLENMPPMIFSADTSSTSSLSGVAALVDKYKPDVLYVDGVYMMQDEEGEKQGSPQALTNLTRGFKRMSQNLHLPIAISTQILEWKMDRKKGITTGSIGYSSSFAQDADVLIGVERTDMEEVNKVKILDGRNVKRMESFVQWDWNTGEFTEIEDPKAFTEEDDAEAATKF